MKSSVIIFNPAARKSSLKKIRRAASYLEGKGLQVRVLPTERAGHAVVLARDAAAGNPDMIIAAGGDGTINEVANGLAGSGVPLAIIPLGTTNVLARELGIPFGTEEALDAALAGTARAVSLGRIESPESGCSRYFCLMAGVGFDGKVVHEINPSFKKVGGKALYVVSGLRNLITYSPGAIRLIIDGKEYGGSTAVIGKAGKYAGEFRITPDATLLDPSFYVCIFRSFKRSGLLGTILGIARGTHLQRKDVLYMKAREVEIYGEAHIQVDGDYCGTTPAKLSIGKDALRIIW